MVSNLVFVKHQNCVVIGKFVMEGSAMNVPIPFLSQGILPATVLRRTRHLEKVLWTFAVQSLAIAVGSSFINCSTYIITVEIMSKFDFQMLQLLNSMVRRY